MSDDVKIDAALMIEQLKRQRNAFADQCALAGAACDTLTEKNAQLKREVEVLSKALEVLKGVKSPLAVVQASPESEASGAQQ